MVHWQDFNFSGFGRELGRVVGRGRINVDFLVLETLPGFAEWDLSLAVKSYVELFPFGIMHVSVVHVHKMLFLRLTAVLFMAIL